MTFRQSRRSLERGIAAEAIESVTREKQIYTWRRLSAFSCALDLEKVVGAGLSACHLFYGSEFN